MTLRVTIAGCGLIGRGWGAAFARAGWDVTLWDRDADALSMAQSAIRASLHDMNRTGLMQGDPESASISINADLAAALRGADYVQESVPEDAAIKASLFLQIDALTTPETLIGSSSSTLPGSRFLSDVPGRERCMVAHPANPPHLMPVVELVPSPWHESAQTERFVNLLSSIGQVPVVLQREVEGFVMNRLQTAVVNEAVALVADGVIAAADLDLVMKHSLGLRWALMGPFETMDLNAPNGFFDYATRYGIHYQSMGETLSVAKPWPDTTLRQIEDSCREQTPSSQIEDRMRWRDVALMRLLSLRENLTEERGCEPA